ncbi:para-aminobenzoate synthase [Eremomyces bilateralis CBS 781.70]|uniref:aminodeoxychorismate synthase n=1 Tax=Eremomyces bilateralis CBS 781.70 TaxID=1392243 RepID=A0A6G1FZA5_9PEZI|nr:para-aminobenzoate synthase [Eremomyces bilateralis CBS 781.70]KAF1811021.1 para-aminobenzoate synthase [Eremomyces bilateralis CBS 781.70]
MADSPKLLFIDSYDSFSQNIVALLSDSIQADIEIIQNDDERFITEHGSIRHDHFRIFLQSFDAIVAGPGPGNPTKSADVGLITALWDLPHQSLLPVLGICLGFQSLGFHFGANVRRLTHPRHGIIQNVAHTKEDIFKGVENVQATQYHSLHVDLGCTNSTWIPLETCPSLLPLAWILDDAENGAILMALKHMKKPFWGVQYHPESICTNPEGGKIISNWWWEAKAWNESNRRRRIDSPMSFSPLEQPAPDIPDDLGEGSLLLPLSIPVNGKPSTFHISSSAYSKSLDQCGWTVQTACQALEASDRELIVLESSNTKVLTGKYSIIGLILDDTIRIHYFAASHMLQIRDGQDHTIFECVVDDAWAYFREFMKNIQVSIVDAGAVPFSGGLMGFISYEAGLDTIGITPSSSPDGQPPSDIAFAFVTRSVVFDHTQKRIVVQSIGAEDEDWVRKTSALLSSMDSDTASPSFMTPAPTVSVQYSPDPKEYCDKVKSCQEEIRAGNSYELCLTDRQILEFDGSCSNDNLPWTLYKQGAFHNPAPFSAYIRLGPLDRGFNILSFSPEKFLSWNREGTCEMRPIKGTLKKTTSDGRRLTCADAEDFFQSPKERAENLMIVDLIRHDLHGALGAGNVEVTKLMGVEEYETVYQLVSVIEGKFKQRTMMAEAVSSSPTDTRPLLAIPSRRLREESLQPRTQRAASGVDVLACSLPPGSMTGAPKKRSCELLQSIEGNQPRGIYSGVLGYMDVGGGGAFSVVIRSAYRWDGDAARWHIGAGGAVTTLSGPEDEYAEMVAKREAALLMFKAIKR